MDNHLYLIYILSFVIGYILGLLLSYKKYSEPFIINKIDVLALIMAIIGWVLALNAQLIPAIPEFITVTVGVFLFAMVFGMRPGYGRYETVIGFAVAGIIWILRTVLL